MSSYMVGGLASIDRWEGLKEWHRRHQDLLQERNVNTDLEVCDTPLQHAVPIVLADGSSLPSKNLSGRLVISKEVDMPAPPAVKHDLSIIPEADEDSRSRDGDIDAWRKKGKIQIEPMKTVSNFKSKEERSSVLTKSNKAVISHTNSMNGAVKQKDDASLDHQVVKKPFLRRGQGLARYNLQPEDVKHPYRKGSVKISSSVSSDSKKSSSILASNRLVNKSNTQLFQRVQPHSSKGSNAIGLTAPMQRLELTVPSKNIQSVELGTWSQVLGADTKLSPPPNSESYFGEWGNRSKQDTLRLPTFQNNYQNNCPTMRNIQSPKRKLNSGNKLHCSPEEDQESLAAYLDLEQHVGNASFCSTSSKVDRLVAKSSKPIIHQSNPDTITQSKPKTPVKTGRKFLNRERDNNTISEDHTGMWSATDLENLIKARARRSGSLIKAGMEPTKVEVDDICTSDNGKAYPHEEASLQNNSEEILDRIDSNDIARPSQESQKTDWMAETLGPPRKPHLMKTMSSIDLDSSLIKNALAPSRSQDESQSDFYTESSSSDSSSEEDFNPVANDCSVLSDSKQLRKVTELPEISKVNAGNSCAPLTPISDITLAEINYQIEAHLSDLRKEIETLQSGKGKTQKYVSNLEKKVQELEHRLILEARSCNKRLEDEREAAAKRLSEEQGRLTKEKQNLQRMLREERRKAPDPITQQELMNLKQEIASWEEKWRTDRAKARGLESNLRIQISNLKRENEKLKEENSKLRREKETALSTAKAKASSNTRVINSIAQNLGNVKPKISIICEKNSKQKPEPRSAYNLKSSLPAKNKKPKPVATIDNFPRTFNEWSSDEEIDLGDETSEEEDINDKNIKITANIQSELKSVDEDTLKLCQSKEETVDLEEAQAKYDAMFGKSGIDSYLTARNDVSSLKVTPATESTTSPKVNQTPQTLEDELFVKSIHHPDGKIEQFKENGTRVVTYPDGTWKRHSSSGSVMTVPPSGWPIQITYFNGDQLEKLIDGTTRYFYAKTNVWQTTYPDGHEELQYPSGQVEHREQDGSVSIHVPCSNGKGLNAEADAGIAVEKLPNGDTVFLLPNGERELHTKEYMKKEFLDGTVKFLYKDGSQETRYPSGRIRIKDAQGNLVQDTTFNP